MKEIEIAVNLTNAKEIIQLLDEIIKKLKEANSLADELANKIN